MVFPILIRFSMLQRSFVYVVLVPNSSRLCGQNREFVWPILGGCAGSKSHSRRTQDCEGPSSGLVPHATPAVGTTKKNNDNDSCHLVRVRVLHSYKSSYSARDSHSRFQKIYITTRVLDRSLAHVYSVARSGK